MKKKHLTLKKVHNCTTHFACDCFMARREELEVRANHLRILAGSVEELLSWNPETIMEAALKQAVVMFVKEATKK